MKDIRYERRRGLFGHLFHRVEQAYSGIFRGINGGLGINWDKLWPPRILGLANLLALRIDLRSKNLHGTDGDLTQPKADFAADFVDDDIIHAVALFERLRGGTDPVSTHVWNGISARTQGLLATLHVEATKQDASLAQVAVERGHRDPLKTAAWQLRCVVSAELNKLLPSHFCDESFIKETELSTQTVTFRNHRPKAVGEDREWLNRWILEDIYPFELRRNRDRMRVCPFHSGPGATHKRTEDGTMNDLAHPAMGCRFSRLARNMQSLRPIEGAPGLLHPNPLLVSQKLLARNGTFTPATTLNLLAGAWIQFQVHDWFSHENEHQEAGKDIRVPAAGDWPPQSVRATVGVDPDGMVLPSTKPDPTNDYPLNSRFPAFRNKDPQWWDASQVYGETVAETLRLRIDPSTNTLCEKGKLYVDPDTGLLPHDENNHIVSGFTDNWWLGIEILHTLFVKEHNAICEKVAAHEPQLTDQEIFEVARLVNCAVMAKIHTVEWTPGIIGHPAIQPALDINWKGTLGILLGEKTARAIAPWVPTDVLKDILTGAPRSEPDHHGAPFALSEEFNAVYRLHPLLPDEVHIRRVGAPKRERTYPTPRVSFMEARRPLAGDETLGDLEGELEKDVLKDNFTLEDVLYSFGVEHPGAVTIGNYPDFLRKLVIPKDPENGRVEEQVMDLGAVDLIRDRERGVPRYNEFRRQLRMKPAATWMDLTGCKKEDSEKKRLAEVLEEVYGELESVDTMVGMFCEENPNKFGFSDTAFRIFILMASRRLKSDRFFTSCYTEEYYTKTGLDWIAETGMREVIERHHPVLRGAMKAGDNPFAPWAGRMHVGSVS